MNAKQAANKIRSIFRTYGVNPKGAVWVKNDDYQTILNIDLRGIYGDTRDDIETDINDIQCDDTFMWEIW